MQAGGHTLLPLSSCFNPCFNGFMDKCLDCGAGECESDLSFNPCFNGFMDKCGAAALVAEVE